MAKRAADPEMRETPAVVFLSVSSVSVVPFDSSPVFPVLSSTSGIVAQSPRVTPAFSASFYKGSTIAIVKLSLSIFEAPTATAVSLMANLALQSSSGVFVQSTVTKSRLES